MAVAAGATRLLVATLLVGHLTLAEDADGHGPDWRYKCIWKRGCQRVPSEPAPTDGTLADSLELCRLTCGKFGALWPRPKAADIGAETVWLHPRNIRFDFDNAPPETWDLLVQMSEVLTRSLLAECRGSVATPPVDNLIAVYLYVKESSLALDWSTDESYAFNVKSTGNHTKVAIVANTVFGARHGLETLSQLAAPTLFADPAGGSRRCGLMMVARAEIKDEPSFRHRGLSLDTSRNFIPMNDIKRTIDGMGASKLNVFHWHATDSHSFPLQFANLPILAKYGAYTPSEVYNEGDIKGLLNYARARGVRVILEIDSPAHAGNGWQWGKLHGLGDLAVCVNAEPWRKNCIQPPCGQLNPANPNVYHVLRDLYREIAALWPRGELFHMGGDEVFIACWNNTKEVVNYMRNKSLNVDEMGFLRLWAEFHGSALAAWDEVNSAETPPPVMIWSSELTKPNHIERFLPADRYVIEVWEPVLSSLQSDLTARGYRTVASPKDVWYLDHGFYGVTKYSNWRRMYEHRLLRHPNVLGGEVSMWSEYVDTNALDDRIWPRAAAVAERLWSDPESDSSSAEPRLQSHRVRLAARGLRPDVLGPQWCRQHDLHCI